jgi:hypothetical protein
MFYENQSRCFGDRKLLSKKTGPTCIQSRVSTRKTKNHLAKPHLERMADNHFSNEVGRFKSSFNTGLLPLHLSDQPLNLPIEN